MTLDYAKLEKDLESLLAQDAYELVDLRYAHEGPRWVLRLFIDKAGGVTIDDCEAVSGKVGAYLDAADLIARSYSLEVSSPGLDRVIKKDADFQRFAGHRVRVNLRVPLDGRRRFSGFLRGLEDGRVVLENEGTVVRLERAGIDEARLDPEIKI